MTASLYGAIWLRLAGPLLGALIAAGCVADSNRNADTGQATVLPAMLSYDCGDGVSISVARLGGGVRVEVAQGDEPDKASPVLHPSPPGQASRFGAEGHALVLEAGEALWMKAGEAPMACRR
jgi:hypothetical protein